MKNIIILIFTVITSIFFGAVAYAGINQCGSNYLHCAYSTDSTNSNSLEGNYIKIGHAILCLPYGSSIVVLSDAINHGVVIGKNSLAFTLCSDKNCDKTVLIGVDNFIINKEANGQYSAIPQLYPFTYKQLAKENNFAPVQCSPVKAQIQ